MIMHSQQLRLGQTFPTSNGTGDGVDYHKMVEVMGGFGTASKPEDIRPALEAAFASGKTACINVKVDPAIISPGSVALEISAVTRR